MERKKLETKEDKRSVVEMAKKKKRVIMEALKKKKTAAAETVKKNKKVEVEDTQEKKKVNVKAVKENKKVKVEVIKDEKKVEVKVAKEKKLDNRVANNIQIILKKAQINKHKMVLPANNPFPKKKLRKVENNKTFVIKSEFKLELMSKENFSSED